MGVVRARVDDAIDASLAGLSWSLRAGGRPLLRRAAHVPEWIRFEASNAELTVRLAGRGMVKEIALSAPLDGERRRQRLVPAISGEVRHERLDERTLRTEILVESGSIVNVYSLADECRLQGHVTITGEQLPAPIIYAMTLRRMVG